MHWAPLAVFITSCCSVFAHATEQVPLHENQKVPIKRVAIIGRFSTYIEIVTLRMHKSDGEKAPEVLDPQLPTTFVNTVMTPRWQ